MEQNNTHTLSIALCTYNGERFLREQLDSLAQQTRLPDEVVVGDDGSTDSTLEILEQWAKEVPFPVRITRNEKNLGFAKNFEATMLRCTGEVIFPCDQDDVWLPEKLEKMTEVLEEKADVGVVYCNNTRIDEHDNAIIADGESSTIWYTYFFPRFLCLAHPYGSGCMMAIRSTILNRLVPFPQHWEHDMWIYLSGCNICEFFSLPVVLIHYRYHANNLSGHQRNGITSGVTYYRDSSVQYRWDEARWLELKEYWLSFPDNPYKDAYMANLVPYREHMNIRIGVQDNLFRKFVPFFWEFLTLRYFSYPQPFKCALFDIKEGLLNVFKFYGYLKKTEI